MPCGASSKSIPQISPLAIPGTTQAASTSVRNAAIPRSFRASPRTISSAMESPAICSAATLAKVNTAVVPSTCNRAGSPSTARKVTSE